MNAKGLNVKIILSGKPLAHLLFLNGNMASLENSMNKNSLSKTGVVKSVVMWYSTYYTLTMTIHAVKVR